MKAEEAKFSHGYFGGVGANIVTGKDVVQEHFDWQREAAQKEYLNVLQPVMKPVFHGRFVHKMQDHAATKFSLLPLVVLGALRWFDSILLRQQKQQRQEEKDSNCCTTENNDINEKNNFGKNGGGGGPIGTEASSSAAAVATNGCPVCAGKSTEQGEEGKTGGENTDVHGESQISGGGGGGGDERPRSSTPVSSLRKLHILRFQNQLRLMMHFGKRRFMLRCMSGSC